MSRIRTRLAASAAAGALAATGLSTAAIAPASATIPAKTVHVFIGKASYVHMTRHMHPGTHRFVVTSAGSSGFQLVRPRRGYTAREAVRDVNAGLEAGHVAAIKRFERNVTLVGGVSSTKYHRGIMWAHMRRGTYWALDSSSEKLRPSMIRSFRVAGGLRSVRAPRANAVIRAIHDIDWAATPKTISRKGVMSWRNRSKDNHFIVMAKLLPGKTIADFKAFVDKINNGQDPGAPPVAEEGGLEVGVLSPGRGMSLRYSKPAGDYVLACFWPDADMGGQPHAFMGMYRAITLR